MDLKVVALDLDGTLVSENGTILPENRDRLHRLQQQGIKVVLVTGRHHVAARPYHAQLGLTTPVVCCNGSYVADMHTGEHLFANPLPQPLALDVLRSAQAAGLHRIVYVEEAMVYEQANDHMTALSRWAQAQPEAVRPAIHRVDDVEQVAQQASRIYKVVTSHQDASRAQRWFNELPWCQQLSGERSWTGRMDVAHHGNSKAAGLQRLLDQWGLSAEQVVAFGDNDNDTSMIKLAGLGIAMQKSTPALLRVADRVIGSHNEPSIAHCLDALF